MKITRLLLVAAASMCLSSLAHAADAIIESAPEPVDVLIVDTNWTGAYIAGVAGYESVDATLEHQNVNNFGGPGGEYWQDGDGFVGGAELGYDYQFTNNVVLGAAVGIRSGVDIDDGGEWEIYHNRTDTKIEYIAVAKARLGYAFGDFLPYLTAGWAGGNVKTSQDYSPPDLPSTTWEQNEFASGYVVGAGADYKITRNIFVGVEYNYTDLGSVDFSGNDSTGRPTKISADLDSHSVLARVGFRF